MAYTHNFYTVEKQSLIVNMQIFHILVLVQITSVYFTKPVEMKNIIQILSSPHGQASSRKLGLIGGEVASPGAVPWMVSVDNSGGIICGGSVSILFPKDF